MTNNKVIVIVVFVLLLLLFPVIYNAVSVGLFQEIERPEPVIEKPGKCVKDTDYMRTSHGRLLMHERKEIVREGKRQNIGLKNCIKCHSNREEFCDRCHGYVGVHTVNEKSGCFACHYYPKTKKEAMEIAER